MSKKLVKAFNALPQSQMARSGLVPNEWHFDVRYVQLEPTPCHVLYIIQPESTFAHVERLPLGVPTDQDGLQWFPNTFEDAPPEIVKALLSIFVHNTMVRMDPHPPPPLAPWKFHTEFKALADATSAEFQRLGISSPSVCTVGVSTKNTTKLAHQQFSRVFQGMLMMLQVPKQVTHFIHVPDSIQFYPSAPPDPPIPGLIQRHGTDEESENAKQMNCMLQYTVAMSNATPPDGSPYTGAAARQRQMEEFEKMELLLKNKPEDRIKAEADRGNSVAALDYGLRLSLGLACERNVELSRKYLHKAATAKPASDKTRAIAHGLLIRMYVDATEHNPRMRYLYAACHHANAASALGKRVSPPGESASPAVLFFVQRQIAGLEGNFPPDWYFFFKDMFAARDERQAQINRSTHDMAEKKEDKPHRYRCAAVGCTIEADTGRKLFRCSGPCDTDKKPSYCGRECQKADWKTHKPFCRPGAPCSVTKSQSFEEAMERSSATRAPEGSLSIPIQNADGTTTLLSSSTWSADELKAIQREAMNGESLAVHDVEEQLSSVHID